MVFFKVIISGELKNVLKMKKNHRELLSRKKEKNIQHRKQNILQLHVTIKRPNNNLTRIVGSGNCRSETGTDYSRFYRWGFPVLLLIPKLKHRLPG